WNSSCAVWSPWNGACSSCACKAATWKRSPRPLIAPSEPSSACLDASRNSSRNPTGTALINHEVLSMALLDDFEKVLQQFDQARRSQTLARIEDYLPPLARTAQGEMDPARRKLLEEL